ncbi:MAG: sugar phosphate isomerase/epimerase family protein [Acidimicrobiales bacterium]
MTARSFGLWWGTVEGADIATLAEVAGAAGFGSISSTPAMYFDARARGASDDDLRELLARTGVTVAVIDPLIRGLPGSLDPESVARRFRSTFEYGADDAFRAAEALGARSINVAHYMGAPTPLDQLIDAIAAIGRDARDRGLQVLVEFMPEGGIRNLGDAAAIVAGVAAPNVAIMLDTWHLFRTAGSLDELEQLPPGAIGAVQVGDATAAAWGTGVDPPSADRLLPGQGVVPIREIVTIARRNNPDVVVGIEVFNRASIEASPSDRAAAAAAAMVATLTGV